MLMMMTMIMLMIMIIMIIIMIIMMVMMMMMRSPGKPPSGTSLHFDQLPTVSPHPLTMIVIIIMVPWSHKMDLTGLIMSNVHFIKE